jgi:hypothetical protein
LLQEAEARLKLERSVDPVQPYELRFELELPIRSEHVVSNKVGVIIMTELLTAMSSPPGGPPAAGRGAAAPPPTWVGTGGRPARGSCKARNTLD